MKVLSYNIHKGIGGGDRLYRIDRIVKVIEEHKPNIICLQEVDNIDILNAFEFGYLFKMVNQRVLADPERRSFGKAVQHDFYLVLGQVAYSFGPHDEALNFFSERLSGKL